MILNAFVQVEEGVIISFHYNNHLTFPVNKSLFIVTGSTTILMSYA